MASRGKAVRKILREKQYWQHDTCGFQTAYPMPLAVAYPRAIFLSGHTALKAYKLEKIPGGSKNDTLFNYVNVVPYKPHCLSTRSLWIKQRSSLVDPTIVTK